MPPKVGPASKTRTIQVVSEHENEGVVVDQLEIEFTDDDIPDEEDPLEEMEEDQIIVTGDVLELRKRVADLEDTVGNMGNELQLLKRKVRTLDPSNFADDFVTNAVMKIFDNNTWNISWCDSKAKQRKLEVPDGLANGTARKLPQNRKITSAPKTSRRYSDEYDEQYDDDDKDYVPNERSTPRRSSSLYSGRGRPSSGRKMESIWEHFESTGVGKEEKCMYCSYSSKHPQAHRLKRHVFHCPELEFQWDESREYMETEKVKKEQRYDGLDFGNDTSSSGRKTQIWSYFEQTGNNKEVACKNCDYTVGYPQANRLLNHLRKCVLANRESLAASMENE